MKYLHIIIAFCFISTGAFAQAYQKAKLNKEIKDLYMLKPSTQLSTVDVITFGGETIKTLKSPITGGSGFVSADNNYAFISDNNGIHRINIADNSIVSIPFEIIEYNSQKLMVAMTMAIMNLNSHPDKIYLRKNPVNQTDITTIDIFEADFSKKAVSPYMSLTVPPVKHGVSGAYNNKYLCIAFANGKVDIYDIETKKLFKTINFNVPAEKIDMNKPFNVFAHIFDGALTFVHQSINTNGTDNAWKFRSTYDMVTNKTTSSLFLEGENADLKEVLKYNSNTEIAYYIKTYKKPPQPYPSPNALTIFPKDIYAKASKVDRDNWTGQYKGNKKRLLADLKAYPDSIFTLKIYSKPAILSQMKGSDLEYWNKEYKYITNVRDSLEANLNMKRREYTENSTNMKKMATCELYSPDDLENALFKLDGWVMFCMFKSDNILKITYMDQSVETYNTDTKQKIESEGSKHALDDF